MVSGGFSDDFHRDIIAGPHGTSLEIDRKTTKAQIKLGFFCQNHAGKGLDVVPKIYFSLERIYLSSQATFAKKKELQM